MGLTVKRALITAAILLVLLQICATAQETLTDSQARIRSLVQALYHFPWKGPGLIGESPTCWDLNLTYPMQALLWAGPAAQDALLAKLGDLQIKDQVIIVLDGIGDERATGPVIEAMVSEKGMATTANAERINRSANIALTNIMAADVIWPHGGGIVIDRSPSDSKQRWTEWWERNKTTFSVRKIDPKSRYYSNYPNYGIYERGRFAF